MRIVDDKALVFETPTPEQITQAVTKSLVLGPVNGGYEVAVKWGLKEAQALATLDVAGVKSPILRDYKWTGKFAPFAHQRETSSFLTLHKRAFCFSDMGTGKTASAIWAADYLMNLGKIKRTLVLCPLSIMKSAWQQDLFKFAMHRSCSIAHGSAKQRAKIINAGSEFVVINFDGVGVVKDEIIAGGFDLIVCDEATAFKSAQTNRWKVFNQIVKATDPTLWMMTGTPAAQSPLDSYGLAKLVNPEGTPRFFGQFRDQTMMKVTQFKWAPRPQADKIVHTVLQPAIRYEKKDCIDLPEVVHVEREAPLTPQQLAYYNIIKNQMLFEAEGEEVSAVNAAVKINKLLQIAGGSVFSEKGEVLDFDVSNRINVVLEVIEEAANKVLIFVPFTHTIDRLKETLDAKKTLRTSCEVINGKVSANRRAQIVQDFQNEQKPNVLIIQPQAASHGLTLTAADTVIWYAPTTSVETYLQANGRINRPGQKNAMTVVHISGSPVEKKLYSMLQGNINDHQKIIDLYRQEMEEGAK